MKRKKLLHNYLFFFGFLYYLIIPLLIAKYNWLSDFPGMNKWHSYFRDEMTLPYLALILSCLLFFYIGSYLPLKYLKPLSYKLILRSKSNAFKMVSWILFAITQIIIFTHANVLFSGYSQRYDNQFLGNLGTLNVVLTFFYIYILISDEDDKNSRLILFTIIEISIILLGMGSRMYVLLPILSYIIYSYETVKINIKKLLIVGTIFFILFLAIGIWRIGNHITPALLAYIFLVEPTFTWYSVSTMYFYNPTLPAISIPINYFSSFINFAPSMIFPNKGEFIIGANDILKFYSPLGADNIIVSLVANFGLVFTPIVFLMLGFCYTTVRINGKSYFWQTYYYLICAILPFQFFRDNLAILNKMYLYNLIFIPAIIIFCYKILSTVKRHHDN